MAMQSDNEVTQAILNIYNRITAPDAAARASLIVASLLIDIRNQNQQIITLLQKKG